MIMTASFLRRAFVVLLAAGFAPQSFAADCPSDFVSRLSGDSLTSYQKKQVADACKGQRFAIGGELEDLDRDRGGSIEIKLKVPAIPQRPRQFDYWIVTLKADHACGDLSKVNKGSQLVIESDFDVYAGYTNRHANAINGSCKHR